MTSMRDDLEKAIANSVRVTVDVRGGVETTRGLDEETVGKIPTAVLHWLSEVPHDGFLAENYDKGVYSRRSVAAMIEDIEDED